MRAVTMTDEQLVQKIANIIRKVAKDPLAAVWPDPGPDGRIGFVIVSPGFKRMTQVGRQEKLRAAMKKHLTPAEANRVGMLFTRAPDEVK